MIELILKSQVWEVYAESFHNITYTFGLYDTEDLAWDVYRSFVKDGIITNTGSSPESGVRPKEVFERRT